MSKNSEQPASWRAFTKPPSSRRAQPALDFGARAQDFLKRITPLSPHTHPGPPEAFIQQALELLASDRYLQKGMGIMALTGRRPAEIFFSASFSLPREKLPYPAILFDGQLENPAGSRHQFPSCSEPRT